EDLILVLDFVSKSGMKSIPSESRPYSANTSLKLRYEKNAHFGFSLRVLASFARSVAKPTLRNFFFVQVKKGEASNLFVAEYSQVIVVELKVLFFQKID